MTEPIQISDAMVIGENRHGYQFGVGRLSSGRWIGYACANVPPDGRGLFVLSQVSDGFELGTLDKERAIKLTGAIACDPESAYGGIDQWFVTDDLRGQAAEFRCEFCGAVGCDGNGCRDDFYSEDEP